ncbi:sarcoplasmic calcium-binding protein-like [Mercenaria mercenaria]|uniref:sarcoplasmic calcium-binding protein-like n=1 Tax=Mercenaria mercenaria TaxID=6596 RepID=UPI00234FB0A1|nr:sarcoplasmic calcium-binding protein-like [Mercenaria mercenaria]
MKMYLAYPISPVLALSYYAAALTVPRELTQASSYLTGKWEEWYIANDLNQDGVLSLDDLETFEEFYTKIDFLEDEQRNHTIATIDRLWRNALLGGRSEVSKDEFVEMLKTSYESNKTNFVETMRELDREFLEVIDLNGDNSLSKEEYMMDLMAAKHMDTFKDEEFFNSHKLVNGLIPIEEAVDVWLRFQTEDDMTKTDILENALKSGL